MIIVFVIGYILAFGLLAKRPIFDDFLEGAKGGMKAVVEILPTLIGLMTAVGVLRASGFLEALSSWLKGFATRIHFPEQLIPLTLVRMVSNSAATGLVLDIFKEYGPDSALGMTASIMMSSTETIFYTMSVYFMVVKVTKTGWTLMGALVTTFVGIVISIWLGQN